MHRVTKATLGTVVIGLVVVILVAGMVGGSLLGAYHAASGQTAKGSSSGTGAVPLAPAAQTYQTTIDLNFNTTGGVPALGADTPVPATFSFYTNVTFGAISNATTDVWVTVYPAAGGAQIAHISLNGTVNSHLVASFVNNGVPTANYTWWVTLDKATLGCAATSCADMFLAVGLPVAITVWVTENGASAGGGLASNSVEIDTTMVSTYASVGFITPYAFPYSLSPVPVTVQFYTNISWGYTSNSTTNVTLEVENYFTSLPFAYLNFSFNGTVNATNSNQFSSTAGFNGTVAGVQYSYTTWTMTLNNTTLVCGAVVSCNSTLPIQTDGLQGLLTYLIVWVNESGASAGGLATATGPMAPSYDAVILGSTLINAGVNSAPLPYQPLPYVATGWINVSWVNPSITAGVGNASVGGYVQVWDAATSAYITSLNANNSVNTTLADGVSLMVAANGTAFGVPFQNYTWTWALSATAASLGANVPYDLLDFYANVTANGNSYGGTVQYTGQTELLSTVFVQYPTVVTPTLTSTFSAYMPFPFQVNYTIAVTNAPISPATTTILVNVTSAAVGLLTSTAVTPLLGQTNYTFEIDSTTLACDAACTDLPQTEYTVSVFVGEIGVGLPTNGSLAQAATSHGFFLIVSPLSATLIAPAPGASVSVGNVSVTVAYVGSYVAGAVANIYSSGGSLVFSHSYIELTPGVPVTATWFIGQTGTYSYSIVMTTVYLPTTHYFNGTIMVITKGGTVYQNVTQYSNQSAISGLSGAAAGTILLVVGLIVGMIVALILARAVMGRPATAPPQPWESKPGTAGAAAPNTCSVCNKSFSTPEELAAHGKSEHGMQ